VRKLPRRAERIATGSFLCSGKIDFREFSACLAAIGYRLADATVRRLFESYDEDRSGTMAFDEYVQAQAELTLFTNLFRVHDTAGRGGEPCLFLPVVVGRAPVPGTAVSADACSHYHFLRAVYCSHSLSASHCIVRGIVSPVHLSRVQSDNDQLSQCTRESSKRSSLTHTFVRRQRPIGPRRYSREWRGVSSQAESIPSSESLLWAAT
jgi:hypothetical protein